MTARTRIALLRGINVGGHHKVPMAELRDLAAGIGLDDPTTYIQSGNLVFESDLDERTVVAALEAAIESRFGFFVPVVMRSSDELVAVSSSHPLADYVSDGRRLMVAFLAAAPSGDVADLIDAAEHHPDRLVGRGREVFLAYPNGSGRSRLTHTLLERRLGVRATLRNWNTVQQLAELVGVA